MSDHIQMGEGLDDDDIYFSKISLKQELNRKGIQPHKKVEANLKKINK